MGKSAANDQADTSDEIFELDALTKFCDSDIVEFVRLPCCNARELRSSSGSRVQPLSESVVSDLVV